MHNTNDLQCFSRFKYFQFVSLPNCIEYLRHGNPAPHWPLKALVTTTIPLRRPPFDSHSTAIRPRYDHSTTYVTAVGLPVAAALRPK